MKRSDKSMNRIFLSPPHMGSRERHFVQQAFDSNYIAPIGPHVQKFELEFSKKVGISHSLAVSSGTAAMHLALRALGVDAEDEVFASTLTFIGGVTPIVFQDANPVFIDSDSNTWTMNVELLATELEACKRRGRLPKAVIPTDIYGQCVDLDRILEVCRPYEIPVIVDSAEALGSLYKNRSAGAGARAAIYSFNGNKIITTSGGGMLASDDKDFIEYARKLSQQAREECSYYEHREIGYNYRLSNILAAIGRGQLEVLDQRVERKRKIFQYYQEGLSDTSGIEFMPEAGYGKSNRWLTVILINPDVFGSDRESVRCALESENIESRPIWKPMHMQPVFIETNNKNSKRSIGNKKRYRARSIGGEIAETLFNRGLCLPSGTALTNDDLDRVISIILKCRLI